MLRLLYYNNHDLHNHLKINNLFMVDSRQFRRAQVNLRISHASHLQVLMANGVLGHWDL